MTRTRSLARAVRQPRTCALLAAAALLLGAVLAARAGATGADTAPPAEPVDPFMVAIDIERSGYLLDLAAEGLVMGPPAHTAPDVDDMQARAAAASHRGLWRLVEVRAKACADGVVARANCGAFALPAWAGEPVGAAVSLEELQARGDWLAEAMAPFVDAGCDAGRAATGEEMFCSVE